MSKYIKLEIAFERLNQLYHGYEVEEWLNSLPTIDIVHCRDCKHRYVTGVTTQYYVCDFMDAQFDGNGYCHHGERIESDE